jgi:hypothetical protein
MSGPLKTKTKSNEVSAVRMRRKNSAVIVGNAKFPVNLPPTIQEKKL